MMCSRGAVQTKTRGVLVGRLDVIGDGFNQSGQIVKAATANALLRSTGQTSIRPD